MGNIAEGLAEGVSQAEAHREMPERFRRAALLSFGIYDDNNDGVDCPRLPSDVKRGLDKASETWGGNDYAWTKGLTHHATFNCPVTHIKYSIHFIETQTKALMVWVTFRGTVDLPNWIANISCALVPVHSTIYGNAQAESVDAHQGFHIAYLAIRLRLLRDFSCLRKSVYSITVVGHSLGGALATNMIFDVVENRASFSSPHKVGLITFGAPPAGNENFVRRLQDGIGGIKYSLQPYCFVNQADMVPHSLKMKTEIVAPIANKQLGTCIRLDPLVHANTVVVLDNVVHAYKKATSNIRTTDSVFDGIVAACLGPHLGQSYIENLEGFLASTRGASLFQKAAKSSNFAAEVGMSALVNLMKI